MFVFGMNPFAASIRVDNFKSNLHRHVDESILGLVSFQFSRLVFNKVCKDTR